MRSVTGAGSLFFTRMQENALSLIELIDLKATGALFHWTTANQVVTAPWSGSDIEYHPFPGRSLNGVDESTDLSVGVIDFAVANSGTVFNALMQSSDLDMAEIVVRRCFADTPGLGQYEVFRGKLGDYSYTRQMISGQARGPFDGLAGQFPPYTYEDNCVWRFTGPGCGVNGSSLTITVPASAFAVNSSSRLNLLVASGTISASYSNGRFGFGKLTMTVGQNSGQLRTIRAHSGDLLELSHALPYSCVSGDVFQIRPGCRKRYEADCTSIYNNSSRFLGFPWIPIQEEAF